MKLLKFFNVPVFLALLLALIYILNFANDKSVIEWRIKHLSFSYSKVDDLYLVNNKYPLNDICYLTQNQKGSSFHNICSFLYQDAVLTNDEHIIDGLKLIVVRKEYIDSIPKIKKEGIINVLKSLKDNDEYVRFYKEYLIEQFS